MWEAFPPQELPLPLSKGGVWIVLITLPGVAIQSGIRAVFRKQTPAQRCGF
jgi:hypothetical protein